MPASVTSPLLLLSSSSSLAEYKRSRETADATDLEFPDEVDTPMDVPARTRFQRFRGLRSFRTSPWDPYENLPVDYARIFGFRNYEQTGRKVMQEAQEEGVPVRSSLGSNIFLRPGADRVGFVLMLIFSLPSLSNRSARTSRSTSRTSPGRCLTR